MATTQTGGQAIETMLLEERRYEPPEDFTSQANAQPDIYERDWEEFWETEGRERISWFEPFTKLYEWEQPYAKWYLGGKLNVCFNCVDRHVEDGRGDRVAYHWEGEPVDDRRTITFAELKRDVVRCANALKKLGVRKGTPVGIYMGMVPELPVAMLACARLGAPHTVVFGGFSADSLSGRLNDMECEVLVTQDEGWRNGATVPLKKNADEALADSPTVQRCVVVRRAGGEGDLEEGRAVWWHDIVEGESDDAESCPCEPMDSEDLLYLLYTSGTTAKPKGIVHTTAGYLTGVATTHHYIFDVKPDSVYWCAADIGWVTGHSYIVYGPLCNGTTGVIYEGVPNFPDKDRWWAIIERYGVDILYTAPTAIRAHMKWGPEYAEQHDLSSLRLLGTVGEPINPEAWAWYRETYWSRFDGAYFAGDGARIDEDGDFWLLGRVDDVMNVSGHRISTIEVESALVDHSEVAEAAVCGRADKLTGQAIVAYVSLKGGREGSVEKLEELREHVGRKIGPIAKPANIVFTPELPKTRSGKIMRRTPRDVAENRVLGDTTTLADPAVVDEIKDRAQSEAKRGE